MDITVNGNLETIEPCTIADFLSGKGFDDGGVVVEHNYQIVKRSDWKAAVLREKDNLEVLCFVGGG